VIAKAVLVIQQEKADLLESRKGIPVALRKERIVVDKRLPPCPG
jgi:hypothetical protein